VIAKDRLERIAQAVLEELAGGLAS
jgi:hypothetical protein